MSQAILHSKQLSIGYPNKTILQDLNLEINRGELITLLGPNGTGKSTLIHTLTGVIPVLTGAIEINGDQLQEMNLSQKATTIAVVLSQKLNPVNLTVEDVVALGRTPYTNWLGKLSNNDRSIVSNALESVNIVHLKDRNIEELSDGEKQRVMIAKALAQDTPLIVLDEPTAHLDVDNRVHLLELLKRLAKEKNIAILLSTHELDLALETADQVWLIDRNKQLHHGAPKQLIEEGKLSQTFETR